MSIGSVLRRFVDLIAPPLCVECGAHAGAAAPLCRACRSQIAGAGEWVSLRELDCWAAFAYDSPAGAVVRSLKFGGRVRVAEFMAAQLAAGAPAALLGHDVSVVPVPAHPRHRRRRGFSHARILAGEFARRAGLGLDDCLERVGEDRPQVGRTRQDRMRGVAGAIRVRHGAPVPASVLIVDDVVTTGATLAACAKALRAAGCAHVAAIAYARTQAR